MDAHAYVSEDQVAVTIGDRPFELIVVSRTYGPSGARAYVGSMELVFEMEASAPLAERAVEVVERKGLGHPDTICDALAEEVSLALCQFYLERFGTILHHNVDKVLLVGGQAAPAFGGGRVLAPIEIYLAGRATADVRGVSVPVDELAREACRSWLRNQLRHLDVDQHVRLHTRVRPGSADLVELFLRRRSAGEAQWLANDTSCGVGFAPSTPLESAVLHTERSLLAPAVRDVHPERGEDIKLMAVRHGAKTRLTVSDALIDRHVQSLDDYRAKRAALRSDVQALAGVEDVEINAADDLDKGSVYLTVTGTSAEAGDDGEAGRGNRVCGLITPYRPMTMESAAGKNPVTHVGKIYNVAARRIAAALVATLDGVCSAECVLVSRIGQPVCEPDLVHIRVWRATGGAAARPLTHTSEPVLRARASELVREHLAQIEQIRHEVIARRALVF